MAEAAPKAEATAAAAATTSTKAEKAAGVSARCIQSRLAVHTFARSSSEYIDIVTPSQLSGGGVHTS